MRDSGRGPGARNDDARLRSLAACGGCAAKAEPGLVAMLTAMLGSLPNRDSSVLAGLSPPDDAAVYRLDDERALVASVDFFPPLADDPADYGRIAAANAVSDIYAMGGELAFALTICGFPSHVAAKHIRAANEAAAQIVSACGGQVLGGHSIRCEEPVLGLSVIGFVHPDRVWLKSGARDGDVLMLSKAIGTGVLLASGSQSAGATAIASMSLTNRDAASALKRCRRPPGAVTDITGYGLVGHASEIADCSGVGLAIDVGSVPLLDGALDLARAGVMTSVTTRLEAAHTVTVPGDIDSARRQLMFDPQTSGGLLASVDRSDADALLDAGFTPIGRVDGSIRGIELR
jgi:selenide,water dikinase